MWRNYSSGLLSAIVGALITAIISIGFAFSPAKVEVGYVERSSLIKLPDDFQRDLKIEYNGSRFSNLSMIEFSILNRGLLQGDIDKAELRFIFKEKDGKPLPSLVSSYLKGPPSLSDVGIEEVKREKGLVVYKIQSLRWTDKEHAYKASFVFEGGALPDFIVDTPTPNVRVIEHRNLIDNAFVFSIVSLFYLVFLIPVCIWVSRSESRSKFRFMNRFRSALVSMPKNTQFSKDEVEKILETYEAVTKPKPYGVRAWLKKKFNDKSSAASLSYENDSQCLRDETADAKRSK